MFYLVLFEVGTEKIVGTDFFSGRCFLVVVFFSGPYVVLF